MTSRRLLGALSKFWSPANHRGVRPYVLVRGILTSSIARGPSEPPLLEQTIGQHFSSIVSKYGDRNAVISRHQNTILTYAQLDADSNALARGFEKLGVKKGHRVAVMLGNGIEFAVATYALFKLGAILVPLNPAFNSGQVLSALNHLTAQHLVISAETKLPRRAPRSNLPLLSDIVPDLQKQKLESQTVPSLQNIIIVDNTDGFSSTSLKSQHKSVTRWADVFHDGEAHYTPLMRNLHPNDVVNIQFTSGTTSMPKAAMLTHKSILNNGFFIGERMLLTPEDVVCCPPPLFHCFGCILGYMATATHGSAIIFPTEAFDAEATLRSVQDYNATALYGVPTMFLAELELLASGAVERTGLSNLRTGIAAGSSIPSNLMRKLHRELYLTQLTICYGQTETSPVSCMTTTDDPLEKRIDSVGRLLPHVSAKIVDPLNHDKIVPIGQRGELAISGYLVMQGYWEDEAKTNEAIQADEHGVLWMHSGDEASMDEEGYVKITGRIKDLIIKGGENIHPLEIENCLLSHQSISQISVVGLPDERYGEAVAAFIVRKGDTGGAALTSEEVKEWVGEKLSHHLVPKHIFWVDDFPKTASGKIQKFKLVEMGKRLLMDGA